MVSIVGLKRADVLAALFNTARPHGLGFLHYKKDHVMTPAEADDLLKENGYLFRDFEGRALRIDLTSEDSFDETGFDAKNGAGTAQVIINSLHAGSGVHSPLTRTIHEYGTQRAARSVRDDIYTHSSVAVDDPLVIAIPAVPSIAFVDDGIDEAFHGFSGGDSGGAGASDTWDTSSSDTGTCDSSSSSDSSSSNSDCSSSSDSSSSSSDS